MASALVSAAGEHFLMASRNFWHKRTPSLQVTPSTRDPGGGSSGGADGGSHPTIYRLGRFSINTAILVFCSVPTPLLTGEQTGKTRRNKRDLGAKLISRSWDTMEVGGVISSAVVPSETDFLSEISPDISFWWQIQAFHVHPVTLLSATRP